MRIKKPGTARRAGRTATASGLFVATVLTTPTTQTLSAGESSLRTRLTSAEPGSAATAPDTAAPPCQRRERNLRAIGRRRQSLTSAGLPPMRAPSPRRIRSPRRRDDSRVHTGCGEPWGPTPQHSAAAPPTVCAPSISGAALPLASAPPIPPQGP